MKFKIYKVDKGWFLCQTFGKSGTFIQSKLFLGLIPDYFLALYCVLRFKWRTKWRMKLNVLK